VEPDYGHTKLRLSQQGLEAIRRIENPIAVVGVSLEELLLFAIFHFFNDTKIFIILISAYYLTNTGHWSI
jgi:hypothetical protein